MHVSEKLLTPNAFSRSQVPIAPRGIVIHWPGVPGQRADTVRNWFEDRKHGDTGYGSAHAVIDLDGEILLCIPWEEEAYHAGDNYPNFAHEAIRLFGPNPNRSTIGIELCHPDATGKPTPDTLMAALDLCATLCTRYGIDPITRIWLHSDVTGKGMAWGIKTEEGPCHRWFIEHRDEWTAFKATIEAEMLNPLREA